MNNEHSSIVLSGALGGATLSEPLAEWIGQVPALKPVSTQLAVGLVTFTSTLVLAPRVERGILLGVAAALAVHLWREMRVQVPAGVVDGALHLRPPGVLYFGSAPAVERVLNQHIADHPDVDKVVVHLDAVGRLDLTGALMLRDLMEEAEAGGRALEIQGAKAHAARLLTRILGPEATVR